MLALKTIPLAKRVTWIKRGIFLLALLPIVSAIVAFYAHRLGANPIEALIHRAGEWALRFLWLTLAVTPLRQILGWRWVQPCRRMLGLFCYFYLLLHIALYWVFDRALVWSEIVADIAKRPFILVGFFAFVVLTPLAITSTDAMIKRLGRNWTALHRLVYVAAIAASIHFWWQQKADIREPAVYAAILLVLLGYRLWRKIFSGKVFLAYGEKVQS